MDRGTRGMSGFALAATVAVAMTSSSNAHAFKRHHSPQERMHAAESPAAAPVQCGNYPGGSTTAVNCAMSYGSGQVISNVQIVPVFWTFGGKTVDATITAWAPPYLSALADSPYLDLLSEYGTTSQGGNQSVTRGTTTAPYTITPTKATTATVKDSAITTELAAQVKAGKLPAVTNDAQGNANTLYVLFFPPGVKITQSNGDASCTVFCGYHGSGSSGGVTYLYAVIPDLAEVQTYPLSDGGTVTEPCGYGCAYQAKTKPEVEWFNGTISHEVGEAVSDPVNGSGWYDQNNSDYACAGSQSNQTPGGGEIGDVCVGFWDDSNGTGECEDTAIIPGFNIAAQKTWSNALNGCYVANAGKAPVCPPSGCVDGGPGPLSPTVDGGSGDDAATGDDASTSDDGSVETDATLGDDGGNPVTGDDGGSLVPGGDSGTPVFGDSSTALSDSGAPAAGNGGSGSSSGCSCRTASGASSSSLAFTGAAMAMLALVRRRSRRKS